jgi:hypothetical protein
MSPPIGNALACHSDGGRPCSCSDLVEEVARRTAAAAAAAVGVCWDAMAVASSGGG